MQPGAAALAAASAPRAGCCWEPEASRSLLFKLSFCSFTHLFIHSFTCSAVLMPAVCRPSAGRGQLRNETDAHCRSSRPCGAHRLGGGWLGEHRVLWEPVECLLAFLQRSVGGRALGSWCPPVLLRSRVLRGARICFSPGQGPEEGKSVPLDRSESAQSYPGCPAGQAAVGV